MTEFKTQPCRGCSEPIFYVKTAASNGKKWIPLNAQPERRILIGEQTGLAHSVTTYMPHHAVCPEADKFRR